MSGAPASGGKPALQAACAVGASVGYGCFVSFLGLLGFQLYRCLRDGEWTPIGVSDGLRALLPHCCVADGDAGRLAALMHWLDAPVDWLGLHKLLEILPASLALFACSILGNSLFIYCRDRLAAGEHPSASPES